MYKLSRVIHAHTRDARCLDYHQGILASGGSDKTFKLYSYKDGNCAQNSSTTLDSEVISIKINKT